MGEMFQMKLINSNLFKFEGKIYWGIPQIYLGWCKEVVNIGMIVEKISDDWEVRIVKNDN